MASARRVWAELHVARRPRSVGAIVEGEEAVDRQVALHSEALRRMVNDRKTLHVWCGGVTKQDEPLIPAPCQLSGVRSALPKYRRRQWPLRPVLLIRRSVDGNQAFALRAEEDTTVLITPCGPASAGKCHWRPRILRGAEFPRFSS